MEATVDTQPLLRLEKVGVSYMLRKSWRTWHRHWALKDINIELHRGDSLGVVGRNGSGKSTLLRLLAGVIGPDEGVMHNAGVRASLLSLKLGFVEYLSGRQNAILSAMFLGMKRQDILARMDEVIAYAELEDFIDVPVATYSSGMKARLAFAVAFQINPDVLLVDEVVGVGDARFRDRSVEAMQARVRSHDSTVVFVSHNANMVRQMCNKAVWIEQGRICATGDVEYVLQKYKNYLRK
jgi:lipopolysaccharide transport system ATP-binding protein